MDTHELEQDQIVESGQLGDGWQFRITMRPSASERNHRSDESMMTTLVRSSDDLIVGNVYGFELDPPDGNDDQYRRLRYSTAKGAKRAMLKAHARLTGEGFVNRLRGLLSK